jgi:CubicO group peptidase (beta-lactamase class C family)
MRLPAIQMLPRRVRVFPSEMVTTCSPREVDPRDVDLPPAAVASIWRAVVDMYEVGMHPGVSICVRHRGEIIVDRAIGHARGNGPNDPLDTPKVPATPDTLFNLFSASKCVTAMLIHKLIEQELVALDDPVAAHIPEFGCRGKGDITIRQVLTHRAGIPTVPGGVVDMDVLGDSAQIIKLLCDARPTGVPGRLAYHALTGGYLLAEIIRRVKGHDVREMLRHEVREPLGIVHFDYGVPADLVDQVADHAFTGPRPPFPASWFLKRALGVPMEEAVRLSNDVRFKTAVIPAGNIIGTAEEACRFFECLLRGGQLGGVRVFEEETVARAVTETSHGEIDAMLMFPVRYGMGFMLGRDLLSFYGPGSPRAFGHMGFTNVLAYADPERDLSVGFMNNGKPFITHAQLQWLNVMRVIAKEIPRSLRRH